MSLRVPTIEDLVRKSLNDLKRLRRDEKLHQLSDSLPDYNIKREIHQIEEALKPHKELILKIQREEGLSKLLDDDSI